MEIDFIIRALVSTQKLLRNNVKLSISGVWVGCKISKFF